MKLLKKPSRDIQHPESHNLKNFSSNKFLVSYEVKGCRYSTNPPLSIARVYCTPKCLYPRSKDTRNLTKILLKRDLARSNSDSIQIISIIQKQVVNCIIIISITPLSKLVTEVRTSRMILMHRANLHGIYIKSLAYIT